jgi:hypothetical protein
MEDLTSIIPESLNEKEFTSSAIISLKEFLK